MGSQWLPLIPGKRPQTILILITSPSHHSLSITSSEEIDRLRIADRGMHTSAACGP